MTATEALRVFPGLYTQQLYAWVAQGRIRAYKTRFTAYTLYSRAEIEKVATPAYPLHYAASGLFPELDAELAS